jgi:hypothetical protein
MLFELFLTLFSFCNRRSLLQNASSPRARWSSLPPTTNRTALTTQNYERYLALAQAEAQKRQHSRGRKLLPARRTLFQIDVLGQRSDIKDFVATIAVIKTDYFDNLSEPSSRKTEPSSRKTRTRPIKRTLKNIAAILFHWNSHVSAGTALHIHR